MTKFLSLIFLGVIFVIIGNIINNRSEIAKKLIDVDSLGGAPFGIPIAVRGKISVDGIRVMYNQFKVCFFERPHSIKMSAHGI